MMRTRIITGVTAAALLLLLIFWGSSFLMMTVSLACAILSYLEYDKLFFTDNSRARHVRQGILLTLTILAVYQTPVAGWVMIWFSGTFLFLFHLWDASHDGDFQKAVHDLSMELMGYWYILGLFGFLVPIAEIKRHYLLLLFMLVFGGDTAAYFVGKRFGKKPLAPHLSPKKTVEGAIAAVSISFGMALFWVYVIYPGPLEPGYAMKVLIFAPVVSVLAQFGDLFESLLKRSQGSKDSGTFLPGHGGILDRVDGLALAAPAFYFYLAYVLERA